MGQEIQHDGGDANALATALRLSVVKLGTHHSDTAATCRARSLFFVNN